MGCGASKRREASTRNPRALRYGSSAAQGPSGRNSSLQQRGGRGFRHSDDRRQETTVKIDKVTIDALDFDRLKKDFFPRSCARASAKLSSPGEVAGDDDAFAMLAPLRRPKRQCRSRTRLPDRPGQESADDLEARGQPARSVQDDSWPLIRDGIDDKTSKGGDRQGRWPAAQRATLEIVDTGLLAKILPAIAKERGHHGGGIGRDDRRCRSRLRDRPGVADAEGARRRGAVHHRLEAAEGPGSRSPSPRPRRPAWPISRR